jgi:hypothetical protein
MLLKALKEEKVILSLREKHISKVTMYIHFGFGVLKAVTMKRVIFCISRRRQQAKLDSLISFLAYSLILKMKAICSSEMLDPLNYIVLQPMKPHTLHVYSLL